MDNFKKIYQILQYLEGAMDCAQPDYDPIRAEVLGISEERRNSIVRMLADSEYVSVETIRDYTRQPNAVALFAPQITLKGLEYLHENSIMKRIMNVAKGIKDVIPHI